MDLNVYYEAVSAIIGLAVGSFLNVVVLRAFTGESIVFPPSKCPSCKNKLKWYHNIPVLSFIALKGKCAFCKAEISRQYPLVELTTGLIFALTFFVFGLSLNTLFMWVIFSILIVLTVTDLKEKIIFTEHTYALAVVGVIYNLFLSGQYGWNFGWICIMLLNSLGGIALGFIFMELIARVSKLISKQRAFGEGDSYILGAIGAVLGYKGILPVFILAVAAQAIVSLPVLLRQYFKDKNYAQFWAFIVFIILAGSYYEWQNQLMYYPVYYFSILIILTALAIYLCVGLIRSIRKGTSLTFIPFGPALALAAFVFVIITAKLPVWNIF